MRWWLRIRLRTPIEVGVASGALHIILVSIIGRFVVGSGLVGYEGQDQPEGLSSLFFFLGVLGVFPLP